MKTLFALAVLAGGFFAVEAQARPVHRLYTPNYSCVQVKGFVAQHGAAILYTSSHTYDRYVAHGGYCSQGEVTMRARVPASDNASCFAGYVCRRWDNR